MASVLASVSMWCYLPTRPQEVAPADCDVTPILLRSRAEWKRYHIQQLRRIEDEEKAEAQEARMEQTAMAKSPSQPNAAERKYRKNIRAAALRNGSVTVPDETQLQLLHSFNIDQGVLKRGQGKFLMIRPLLQCFLKVMRSSRLADQMPVFPVLGTSLAAYRGWQQPWDFDVHTRKHTQERTRAPARMRARIIACVCTLAFSRTEPRDARATTTPDGLWLGSHGAHSHGTL